MQGMIQNEARLRSVAEALASGEYGDSYERLAKHFSRPYTAITDTEIVKSECGAACHWGGNGLGGRMSAEMYQKAWSQSNTLALCHDCTPKGVSLRTHDVKCFFTWSQIAKEMRRMFKAKSDNVDAFTDRHAEPLGVSTEKEGETMSNAITKETVAAALPTQRLKEIEYEIHFHVTHAAGHLLEVGRCLNAAKDEGLVPHGQWELWVEQNAGVGVRTAQRMMAAAREIAADSPLARLEFSKVRALLALPAGEREEFAEEHNADSASVRELEAAIKAKQEAERRLKEVEDSREVALKEKTQAMRQADAAKRDAQVYLEDKRALEREEENLHDQLRLRRADIDRLKGELDNAMTNGISDGISTEAQAKIDALQAELEAQEAEIERQAKLRAEAQAELLRARSQAARGETGESAGEQFTADDLGAAARLFIGRAAVLPHMAAQLAAMPENERRAYRQYIDMLADWCESSRAALDTIEAGVIDG